MEAREDKAAGETPPEPFDRIEFRTIGREKDRQDVGRPVHGFSGVPGAVVEYEQVQRIRKGGGKAVHPPLERAAVEIGQFEKKVCSRGRFDGTVQIEIVELVRHGGHGLDSTGRNPPPDDRE